MVVVMRSALNMMVVVYRLRGASLEQARLPSIHSRSGGGILVVVMVMVMTTMSVKIYTEMIAGGLTGDEPGDGGDGPEDEHACCAWHLVRLSELLVHHCYRRRRHYFRPSPSSVFFLAVN